MANRLKSKKGQGPASGKLKPEKESRVTARQIAKDERTHKITGAVFLLLAIFLFLAFTSYLFTWKEDHVKVTSWQHRIPDAVLECESDQSFGELGGAGIALVLF